MSTPNRHSARPSEVTLTPALDGSSDYQQYLEKTSRRDSSVNTESRGKSSLMISPPPTATSANPRNTSSLTHPPGENTEIQPAVATAPVYEEIKPAQKRRARKKRPHRVEAVEDPHEYPGPLALTLLTIGICLSVFLVSLDRTIVATVGTSYHAKEAMRRLLMLAFPGHTTHY